MKEDELNYSEDIKIERDALDKEWLGQASLYNDYGEALADAKRDMAKAHERVKICRSDLIVEAKLKLEKPTMQEIEAYYRLNKKHQNAKTEFINAEHKVNMLMTAVISFAQRKTSLENLVVLWKNGYYAKPREERDPNAPMRQLGAEASRKGRKKVEKRMRRNQT